MKQHVRTWKGPQTETWVCGQYSRGGGRNCQLLRAGRHCQINVQLGQSFEAKQYSTNGTYGWVPMDDFGQS